MNTSPVKADIVTQLIAGFKHKPFRWKILAYQKVAQVLIFPVLLLRSCSHKLSAPLMLN
jgi:hypothetical protein